MCDELLVACGHFDEIYAADGAPSIPPETLLKGKAFQALHTCVRIGNKAAKLTTMAKRPKSDERTALRARIVLDWASGMSNTAVFARVGEDQLGAAAGRTNLAGVVDRAIHRAVHDRRVRGGDSAKAWFNSAERRGPRNVRLCHSGPSRRS